MCLFRLVFCEKVCSHTRHGCLSLLRCRFNIVFDSAIKMQPFLPHCPLHGRRRDGRRHLGMATNDRGEKNGLQFQLKTTTNVCFQTRVTFLYFFKKHLKTFAFCLLRLLPAETKMIRYEFGDGKSTFIFFKDRGGKENHKNVLFFLFTFHPSAYLHREDSLLTTALRDRRVAEHAGRCAVH